MLRLWVLPALGLIAALAVGCSNDSEDMPPNVPSPSMSPTATLKQSPTASALTTSPLPNVTVPADWPTFVSWDGLFTLRYPPSWFAEPQPTPPASPQAYGYEVGILYNMDPHKLGPTPPPTVSKVDLEVSLPGSSDCPTQPAGASAATLGGVAGWRVTRTEPIDGLTADSFGAYSGGHCFLVIGYFGPDNHDQGIFEQVVKSFTFKTSGQ